MRFMLMIKGDGTFEAGKAARARNSTALDTYGEEMRRAGVLLERCELHPSAEGARVHVAGGKATVSEGPLGATDGRIGSYAIIQAASRAEAIEHARRLLQREARAHGPDFEGGIEVRQIAQRE